MSLYVPRIDAGEKTRYVERFSRSLHMHVFSQEKNGIPYDFALSDAAHAWCTEQWGPEHHTNRPPAERWRFWNGQFRIHSTDMAMAFKLRWG